MNEAGLLLVQAFATLGMVGVIWFVQLVHYPLMGKVGPNAFVAFEEAHVRRTSWIVVPLMLAECFSAVALCALLAAIWGSTFLVQVPLHAHLERGFDAVHHQKLVRTNWVRTALWSARGALVLAWLGRAIS
jgi:hypothetical protein